VTSRTALSGMSQLRQGPFIVTRFLLILPTTFFILAS
jgi:hypothetical protein